MLLTIVTHDPFKNEYFVIKIAFLKVRKMYNVTFKILLLQVVLWSCKYLTVFLPVVP